MDCSQVEKSALLREVPLGKSAVVLLRVGAKADVGCDVGRGEGGAGRVAVRHKTKLHARITSADRWPRATREGGPKEAGRVARALNVRQKTVLSPTCNAFLWL